MPPSFIVACNWDATAMAVSLSQGHNLTEQIGAIPLSQGNRASSAAALNCRDTFWTA
jgi:hypothetical protein